MWDPYGKVDHLPVAIVNEDKPVTYNDEALEVGKDVYKRQIKYEGYISLL